MGVWVTSFVRTEEGGAMQPHAQGCQEMGGTGRTPPELMGGMWSFDTWISGFGLLNWERMNFGRRPPMYGAQ